VKTHAAGTLREGSLPPYYTSMPDYLLPVGHEEFVLHKDKSTVTTNNVGQVKTIFSATNGWLTVDVPKDENKKKNEYYRPSHPIHERHGRANAPELMKTYTTADKNKYEKMKPNWMQNKNAKNNFTRQKSPTGAGSITPREAAGDLFAMFKARTPVGVNLRDEKTRMVLFDSEPHQAPKNLPFGKEHYTGTGRRFAAEQRNMFATGHKQNNFTF